MLAFPTLNVKGSPENVTVLYSSSSAVRLSFGGTILPR